MSQLQFDQIAGATCLALAINWNAWAVVVSVVFSTAGLFFVGFSLRQVKQSLDMTKHSLDMTITGNLYGSLHSIHSTFIEYPGLRPYFYHDAPLSRKKVGDEEYFRARAIAEMYLDTFEYILSIGRGAPGDLPFLTEEYIRHMCKSSSFLRAYLLESPELLHPPKLRHIVEGEERKATQKSGNKMAPNTIDQADS